VGSGAVFEKEADDGNVAEPGGDEERSDAVGVGGIDGKGVEAKEAAEGDEVGVLRGAMERIDGRLCCI
jgi:hypothetical protein